MSYQKAKSDLIFTYALFCAFFAAFVAGLILVAFLIMPIEVQTPKSTPLSQTIQLQGSSPDLQPTVSGKSLQGSN